MNDRFDETAAGMTEEQQEQESRQEELEREAQGAEPPSDREDGQDSEESSEQGGDEGYDTAPSPGVELTALREQVNELQNRLLRAQADFDNYRKRTRQEKDELVSYANAKLIGELLPVLDHFSLAMQVVDETTDSGALAKGIDMVYKQLLDVLDKVGLKALDPEGEVFDPKRHEAVMSETVEGAAPGTVVQVLRSGYTLHERVLRPAMVKISQ